MKPYIQKVLIIDVFVVIFSLIKLINQFCFGLFLSAVCLYFCLFLFLYLFMCVQVHLFRSSGNGSGISCDTTTPMECVLCQLSLSCWLGGAHKNTHTFLPLTLAC